MTATLSDRLEELGKAATQVVYQSAADCPLGDAHGYASTHHDKDDVEVCDWCGFPADEGPEILATLQGGEG